MAASKQGIKSELHLPAPAKINLFLHILGRRADGYHDLQTAFQFLDFGDELIFRPNSSTDIRISPELAGVKVTDNLIYRAAELLRQHSGVSLGVDVEVQKHIPQGGGLGGGSSNAATTLVALNYLWQLGLTQDTLAEIGVSLGADVPVFIFAQSAWAEGVGERLQAIFPPEPWYLLIFPQVLVPTSKIFSLPELTRDSLPCKICDLLHESDDGDSYRLFGNNDCQAVVEASYPQVAAALKALEPFAAPRMSGTGSSVFAAFTTREAAEAARKQLPADTVAFIARGCNQSPLRDFVTRLDSAN